MTVVSCNLISDGQETELDKKGVREYDEVYKVVVDDPSTGRFDAANATDLPGLYEPYEFDPGALCVGRKAQAVSDGYGYVFDVTCHYSSEYDQEEEEDPLERAPRWWIDGVEFTRPATEDVDGDPILNLAGDPYEDPQDVDDGYLVLMVRRNEKSYADIIANVRTYIRTVNASEWNGFAAGTVLLKKITSGELKFENGESFYPVTYEFYVNEEGWALWLLEIGYNAKLALRGPPPTFQKVPCAGDHPKLLVPTPIVGGCQFTDDATKAVYTDWYVRGESEFDDLNLPFPDDEEEEGAL